ncbi:amidohydrolase [Streptomyces sp. HC44]|uniref:Amidohydrolase n=2 Tax=Streptomyces scabichelini TaxID=2711217 RepID=A0A6G4V9R6_9ACTN|nr:amidohydrolase [Streptomyces scabichelini]
MTGPRPGTSRPALVLSGVRLGAGGPVSTLRIEGGRITAIAPAADDGNLKAAAGERILDLGGRTALPGLWDAHIHATQWAGTRRRMDLSAFASARAVTDAVRTRAAELPPAELLVGYGFRDGLWPDVPHKRLLDAVQPDRPVALISGDLHTAWMNSPCLALVGHGDHPTGVLREHDCLAAVSTLPGVPAEVSDRWVAEACRAAAARGVTGFTDFEYADNVTDWTRRSAEAPPQVRVSAAVYPEYLAQAIGRELRTGDTLAETEGRVRVGPLKLFTDGSLNTRTALCHEPYPGLEGTPAAYGVEQTPYEELVRLMRLASSHGIEPAVHAIGDRANTMALDAFATVRCRGRIEHAQLLTAADIPRFAELGITAGVQPAHATDDRDVADRYWAGRTERAFPYADLLAAGARLELGSDAPVAPLDPWMSIASAVSRTSDDRPSWHPEQELPVREALTAAARGRHLIRVGDDADLAIVDTDPLEADAHTLRDMPVHATMLAGTWTHGPY